MNTHIDEAKPGLLCSREDDSSLSENHNFRSEDRDIMNACGS